MAESAVCEDEFKNEFKRSSKDGRGCGDQKWARASRGPISLKIDQIRGSSLENRLYCLLYTILLFTASAFAFVPVWVMVMVLPSAETTTFAAIVAFPPFFQVLS